MKKLVMLLLCSGLLVACTSSKYSVKVSDDQTIVSGGRIEITKQDYFEYLLDSLGANKVLTDALTAIADKEITNQYDIDALLKERKELYAEYAGGNLETYAKNIGYESEEEFVNDALLPDVKQELLRNKYIEDNYESLLSDYQVTCFKKIVVDKESTALDIIEAATDEDAFDKQMSKYGTDAEDAGIVTKNSTLDENLQKKLGTLSAIEKDGVYKEAIQLSDESYAVIFVYDTARENKEEYITALTSDSDLQEEIEGIYLKQYNFTVNDKKIKNAIKQLSSQYIE